MASVISTFTSQVEFASALIVSGAEASASFTSSTVPLTGANRSLTAFTLSTEPNVAPAWISEPTRGRSTKTMSPSESCA